MLAWWRWISGWAEILILPLFRIKITLSQISRLKKVNYSIEVRIWMLMGPFDSHMTRFSRKMLVILFLDIKSWVWLIFSNCVFFTNRKRYFPVLGYQNISLFRNLWWIILGWARNLKFAFWGISLNSLMPKTFFRSLCRTSV